MSGTLSAAVTSGRAARAFLLVALVALAIAAWWWLLPMHMAPMNVLRVGMPADPMPWSTGTAMFLFVMWSVMMAGMMIPSALPMVLVHDRVARGHADTHPLVATIAFVAAYLIVWIGFSAAATAAQWLLERGRLMSGMMASANVLLSGALLIAAGLFQWSPLKYVCLSKCRTPMSFILNEWRPGVGGAFVTGLRHGVYCLGCCWALMALLFVFGTMNLVAAAALTILVLAEKALPWGLAIARAAGAVLAAWGAWVVASALT
jgi:predicted metal-binding membrane protein